MSKRGDTSPITPVKDKSLLLKNRFSIQLNFGNLFSTDKHVYILHPPSPHWRLKSNASTVWNSLPRNMILQETHGEFKNEFYNFKLSP